MKGMPQENGNGNVWILNAGGRDVVPRTMRTTSFWMLCEFWEHESLKHMKTNGED